ncbi:MAG: hypothetical protein F6K35_50995, partial [Okeania sp. SIO2H7]|nr:hypothetical protein [Okeania sp. SIO2H7]
MSTCPSYQVMGKRIDSPRGRIYLIDAINQSDAPRLKLVKRATNRRSPLEILGLQE